MRGLAFRSQWRVVFRWTEGNVREVRLTDYHS